MRLRTRTQIVLLTAVRQRPRALGRPYSLWTLQRLADYLAELTGIRLTYETVRVALKAGGIVLSRPQHTVSSPDPDYRVKKPTAANLGGKGPPPGRRGKPPGLCGSGVGRGGPPGEW